MFFLNKISTPATAENRHADLFLQYRFREANAATIGVDDSLNGFDWTGVADAEVQSNRLDLDGTGDYASTGAANHDFNFMHNGGVWTMEVVFDGRPPNNSALFDTLAGSSANNGVSVLAYANGDIRVLIGKNPSSVFIFDTTASAVIPNDTDLHHLVVEYDPGDANTSPTDRIKIGVDGTRVSTSLTANSQLLTIADPTYAARIGGHNTAPAWHLNGQIAGFRIYRDYLKYDLFNNSSYTAEDDPSVWPIAETGNGPRVFAPRYIPKEETTAAGYDPTQTYRSEPRCLYLGDGEIILFRHEGTSHSSNTTMEVVMYRSTDYGRTFPVSTAVVVASDATYAARNHAIGRDAVSGRLVCFYRTVNSSDVTQSRYFKTSTDDGATWSSATDISSSLNGTTPFGHVVQTSNGLMAVFYTTDFAEALFSTDGGQTWGSNTEIYDVTGTAPGYNEPQTIAVSEDNIIVISRKEGGQTGVWYKSSDGGSTWGSGTEFTKTGTTSAASPVSMARYGSKVMSGWTARKSECDVYYSVTDKDDFFTNPARAFDGTETATVVRSMRSHSTWTSARDSEYSYVDFATIDDNYAFFSWYEPIQNSQFITRTWAATVAI